jgi:hypothetical protein
MDALQWTGQLVAAALASAGAVAALALVVLRRYRYGVVAIAQSSACFAAYGAFLAQMG